MRIALIQLHANDKKWAPEEIPHLILNAEGADLIVFPEAMPFGLEKGRKVPSIETAVNRLCDLGTFDTAFVAGGYVKDGNVKRNAAFLIHKGRLCGEYFKRIMWQDETAISSGPCGVKFSWDRFSCIPLICADAGDDSSKRVTAMMMNEALVLGANADTPIVVPSYGARLKTDYWHVPLIAWAQTCDAPVAICGVSGRSKEAYIENGKEKYYGGGGSGVFWPDGTHTQQSGERGIYMVDISTRRQSFVVI